MTGYIEKICERDPRYRADAYVFVMEALHFTQRRQKAPRHISGKELLSGVRDLTVRRFGPLAFNVMDHWGDQKHGRYREHCFQYG